MTYSPTSGPTVPLQEPGPPARASDADRAAVVALLHDAVTRGMLTLEECDERVAAAYAARFVRELPPLTADLPPATAPAPVAPGWGALVAMALLQLRTSLADSPWSGTVRSRPRLAVAVVLVLAALAVLALGVMTLEELFEFDGD